MIPVTKTFFPPLDEYNVYLNRIWKNEWLTNRGQLVEELEKLLKEKLGVSNLFLTTNGTLPLQLILNTLEVGSEVITTPFSYVATTSTIIWEKCIPVFVDINDEYLTIDENLIEEAITENTKAILATHVFGNPCNVEALEKIAKKHNLILIYDAAHCFGVNYKGKSIFDYGDVSTCSFHATKIFHTGEGGALFCNNESLYNELFHSHKFGHMGPTDFLNVGINAKISELQAAMGLSVLPYFENIKENRRIIVELYNQELDREKFKFLKIREGTDWNFSYYPVIFENEDNLLSAMKNLTKENIHPRRYFYPSLNNLPYVKSVVMRNSDSIAKRILCLPLYKDLDLDMVQKIITILNSSK